MIHKSLARVLFAGGGTGGHVFMAVALATELRERDPNIGLLFAGTEEGLESRLVPQLGFDLQTIRIGGLKRVGLKRTLFTLFQLPLSLIESLKIVRQFSPSIVVGVGGYSSGPLVIAGRAAGAPSLIIEPNAHPGFTNRLLSRWVAGAAVAYEETARWFGKKARLTGIPIRKEFFQIAGPEADSEDRRLRLLVFGGSRGSSPINSLVVETLPYLDSSSIRIIHQTGKSELAGVKKAYKTSTVEAEILPFINDMPAMFSRADLVLSRAGASTIAEIAAAGKPAILIPFPYAADNHQQKNAEALESKGAAIMLHQHQTKGADLAKKLATLNGERTRLENMSTAAKGLAKPYAANEIIQFMEEIVN